MRDPKAVVSATRLEQRAGKRPVEQIEADLKFDARLGGAVVAAATGPESSQYIRQRHNRAVEETHTAAEPLQDWNGDGVGCQDSADSRLQNFPEAICGLGSEALVKTLGGDLDSECRCGLT